MAEFLRDLLYNLPLFTLLGAVCGMAFGSATDLSTRLRKWLSPERNEDKWTIALSDPDGIPMRSDSASAEGIARLIRDINAGYYK